VDQLVGLLSGPESAVRREAATSLGRIGSVDAVPALLKAFENAGDRVLEHTVIYALIDINDPETTRAGLENPSARVRRAALVALDQMEKSKLTREMVSPLLKTDDVVLLESVVDVVGRHPGWVEIVSELLTSWLLEPELTAARHLLLRDAVYALRRQPACQTLMAELLSRPETSVDSRILLLDVMIDSGFREFPVIWQQQVHSNVVSSNIRVAGKSLIAMASTNARQFDDGLLKYVQDTTRPVSLRVQAASILSRNRSALPEATFELLRSQCSQDAAFETRLEAARAIGNLKLSFEELDSVIGIVAQAGPLELPLLFKPLAGVW
jgi:HEAT repeat protein